MSASRWVLVVLATTVLAYGARSAVGSDDHPLPATLTRSVDIDETSRLIEVFERRLEERTDFPDLAALGGLYLSRARTSGALEDHIAAHRVFSEAVALAPKTPEALLGLAQADLALHDFEAALSGAAQAVELDPAAHQGMAVVFDAALALGDVPRATGALSVLDQVAGDDPAVLIRAAELAWITGDVESATALATEARSEAVERSLDPATAAVFRAYEARVLTDTGRYQEALNALETATPDAPILFQRGRALAALGDSHGAISALEQAAAMRPDPAFLVELADLYLAAGDADRAAEVDATIGAVAALDEAGVYDRIIAGWLADRAMEPERALALAAADGRQDPAGHDLRAWTLFRSGRLREARHEADLAQSLGTPDAGIAYHSGVIWAALGQPERAARDLGQALDRSPRFDPVHADLAAALLEEVRS